MTDHGPRGPGDHLGLNEPDDQPGVYADNPPAANTRQADPWTMILGILGGVLLGTGVTFAVLGFVGVFEEPPPPTVPPAPTLTAPPPTGPPPTLGGTVTATAVAQRVIPSTVFVETSSFLAEGSGSGVIYGSDGYIVTNHHVVQGSPRCRVELLDGRSLWARVIGSDPDTDLALLHVAGEDFDALVKEYTNDSHPGIYTMVNRGVAQPPGVSKRGDMAVNFGDISFRLDLGEIGMAKFHAELSPFGWHIIKRIE